jgi:hypothetical protein
MAVVAAWQRANGAEGPGQRRRREGSDGEISSLSDGRCAHPQLNRHLQPLLACPWLMALTAAGFMSSMHDVCDGA